MRVAQCTYLISKDQEIDLTLRRDETEDCSRATVLSDCCRLSWTGSTEICPAITSPGSAEGVRLSVVVAGVWGGESGLGEYRARMGVSIPSTASSCVPLLARTWLYGRCVISLVIRSISNRNSSGRVPELPFNLSNMVSVCAYSANAHEEIESSSLTTASCFFVNLDLYRFHG